MGSIGEILSGGALGGIEEIDSGLRWSGLRLKSEIAARQAVLSARGLGRGARIVIAHGGTAYFFADLLAVWSIGAVAICLDPGLTRAELENLIGFARPRCVLIRETCSVPISGSLEVEVLDLSREAPPATALPALGHQGPGDPALVLFTSGTTGTPKGVVLSAGALAYRTAINAEIIGREKLARSLVTLATHFGHGLIGNSLTPLFGGCDIVIPPSGASLARDLGRIVDDCGISFMSSVPAFWKLALRLTNPPSRGSLARIHVGSSPLAGALWRDIASWSGTEVVNCYGMTETANWFAGCSSREQIAEGLVGVPWGGRAAVAGSAGTIAERGEGEIVVTSASLMSKYLDRPDLTESVLRDGWYFTGDRGRIDGDGRVWLTGRIKDEINRAGFKVQPEEIDRVLESHPGVAEACVFGVSDPVTGEAVAAALRMKDGVELDLDVLRNWCLTRMRREAMPQHWFFVESIPRTSRGKLNRGEVRRQLLQTREA